MSDANKSLVLETMRKYGLYNAEKLQTASDEMTGTAIIEQLDFIPMKFIGLSMMATIFGGLRKCLAFGRWWRYDR